jgi:O-antigen/teichoic acid export membrane protein
MGDSRTIAQNTIFLTIAQFILIASGIISMKLTTTGLGTYNYGLFGYATSFNTIICSIMDLGLAWLMTREVARDRSIVEKYISNFLTIRLTIAFVILGGILAAVYVGLVPDEAKLVVYIVSLSVIFNLLTSLFVAVFQSYEKMGYIAVQTALTSVLTMGAAALMWYLKLDVTAYAVLYSLAYLIVLVFCIGSCALKFTKPIPAFDLDFWKDSLKESLPFGIASMFGVVYYQSGTILLEYFTKNVTAVGIFRAPFNLYMTILFIPQVLTTALFPVMSKYFVTSPGGLEKIFNKFLKYIMIISLPMGVGTTILADKIIYTLTDSQYTESISVLQILIWAAVFLFVSSAFMSLMNSSNKQRTTMKIGFACMVLNIILGILLIPGLSYIGAAISSTVTEFFELALYALAFLRLKLGLSKDTAIVMAKSAAASLLMGGFLLYFRQLNLFLLVIAGAAIYFAALYVFRTFDREDIDIIGQIIGSRSRPQEAGSK